MNDQSVVAAQIERPLRANIDVEARCHLGLPIVVAVPPILDDGTPFPTRYWLSCPLAVRRVSRLESAGAIARLEATVATVSGLQAAMVDVADRYATERAAALPPDADPAPSGGVGGNQGDGLKCLHAHFADTAAGNVNPVGIMVRPFVEPLDCDQPCVRPADSGVELNPDWREPR